MKQISLFISAIIFSGIVFSQNYSIKGQVIDSVSNKPIAFADIQVFVDTVSIKTITTDTNGYFQITNIKQKNVKLYCYKIAVLEYAMTAYRAKNIYLKLNKKEENIVVKLAPLPPPVPDRYMVNNNDTIYYKLHHSYNDWKITSVDGPSRKYCNGKPCNGLVRTYFINGQIKETGHFKNGYLDNGNYVHYYKNGIVDYKGKIKNTKRVGQWVFQDSSGFINFIVMYDTLGNKESEISFFKNGYIEECIHRDEKKNIYQELSFDENGMIESIIIKKNKLLKKYKIDKNGIIKLH